MVQKMADLSREGCEPGRAPFCFVGVDLFGIFYAKVGRSEVKSSLMFVFVFFDQSHPYRSTEQS